MGESNFHSRWVICRFHVNLQGCKHVYLFRETNMSCFSSCFGIDDFLFLLSWIGHVVYLERVNSEFYPPKQMPPWNLQLGRKWYVDEWGFDRFDLWHLKFEVLRWLHRLTLVLHLRILRDLYICAELHQHKPTKREGILHIYSRRSRRIPSRSLT